MNVILRILHPAERYRFREHLLRLSPEDLYLRFGTAVKPQWIHRYVDGIPYRDPIVGAFNEELELVGAIHIGLHRRGGRREVEIGLSVESAYRNRGLGSRLLRRAVVWAESRGIHRLFLFCMPDNRPMLRVARKNGAKVRWTEDGGEACLTLRRPTPASWWREALAVQQGWWQLQAVALRRGKAWGRVA